MKVFMLPVITSFIITLVFGKVLIPMLKKQKASQTEREELESHKKKEGTPTMGGLMFLLGFTVATVFYLVFNQFNLHVLVILLVTLGFGLIGFLDDFLKVVKRKSDGLLPWQKMLISLVITTIYFVYAVKSNVHLLSIPFKCFGLYAAIPWPIYMVLFFLCILGTVNGVNFTDGVDGLATTVTIVVCVFFGYVSAAYFDGQINSVIGAMFGGLLGFLVYNANPAKIFMGDTGSLALGGFVAAVATEMHVPWLIIIVGFIYLLEVVSVILQVGYFKLTHGKRIFRMAPIHHHFELGGWSEVKVVAVFAVITALLALAGSCLI
ncbi:MAG: phospho-N-acetylmuramoyl-pentapeptide-transferase [Lachnospiraceae bacterium]|nr:phospho-N-acetylmuramoyl-pentapeptide-transferase [Lachnospiraceae bacterium]